MCWFGHRDLDVVSLVVPIHALPKEVRSKALAGCFVTKTIFKAHHLRWRELCKKVNMQNDIYREVTQEPIALSASPSSPTTISHSWVSSILPLKWCLDLIAKALKHNENKKTKDGKANPDGSKQKATFICAHIYSYWFPEQVNTTHISESSTDDAK